MFYFPDQLQLHFYTLLHPHAIALLDPQQCSCTIELCRAMALAARWMRDTATASASCETPFHLLGECDHTVRHASAYVHRPCEYHDPCLSRGLPHVI